MIETKKGVKFDKNMTFRSLYRQGDTIPLDMKQLTTFLTLMRTRSYQKAAEELNYAPSTLFKHIQVLEQQLGVPLFSRDGRMLRPTEEGNAFAAHAQRMLDDYHRALEDIASMRADREAVAVGGCELNTCASLHSLFAQFVREQPNVSLDMFTSANAGVPGLVRDGMIDVGFYYSIGRHEYAGLRSLSLFEEPVLMMAAKENPIVRECSLHYEDLQGMSFVHTHDSCCFVLELMPRLRERGVSFGRNAYLGGVPLVVEFAHDEDAVMLTPYSAVDFFRETCGMAPLSLDEEPLVTLEQAIFRDGETLRPAARSLVEHAVRYARRRQEGVAFRGCGSGT